MNETFPSTYSDGTDVTVTVTCTTQGCDAPGRVRVWPGDEVLCMDCYDYLYTHGKVEAAGPIDLNETFGRR